MSESEKKWEKWDEDVYTQWLKGLHTADIPKQSREAYKSQLKKLIEEEIAKIRSDKYHSSYDLKAIQTLEKVLLLTEEVKPPQP